VRYTAAHGPLIRSDGRTSPIPLDDIERLFGEYVLNAVMEKPGQWIDVTAPQGVIVTATVNGRSYTVHVRPADSLSADFIVETDAGTITLPINAPMFSLVEALNQAAQHEPLVLKQPHTKRCRCWTRDRNLIVCVVVDGRKIEARWCWAGVEAKPLFDRIAEANNAAWKWQGDQRPTGRAFIDLTDAELATLDAIASKEIPPARPITSRPVQPNPAARGAASSVTA
jgi:hypothetical protein